MRQGPLELCGRPCQIETRARHSQRPPLKGGGLCAFRSAGTSRPSSSESQLNPGRAGLVRIRFGDGGPVNEGLNEWRLRTAVSLRIRGNSYLERHTMGRALCALYGAGALLTGLSILLPHSEGVNEQAALINAAVALTAAIVVWYVGSKLPLAGFQILITLGSLMISLGVHFGGYARGTPSYALFYLWVILFAFSFFPVVAGLIQAGIAAAAHLMVLAIDGQVVNLISDWALTWGVLFVAGLIVGWFSGQVEELAVTDALTGLRNRRAWEDELNRELARASRTGHPISVVLLDIDGLKAVNDEDGHQAGDRLLKEATTAWSASLRIGDFLARLGGDEFGLLLAACPADGAHKAVERLRASTPVPFSAGCSTWDRQETGESLMHRSDLALYENKRSSSPVEAEMEHQRR